MLQRLSVFARSWTIEAAEAVCAGEEIAVSDVLNLLSGLVDKSLVQAFKAEGDQEQCNECYRMLETVRQYARDRLLESGGSEAVRDRHLGYYLKLGELADTEITGSKQLAWVNRLEGELENLRLALEWSLGTSRSAAGRGEDGLRLAASLMWFWHFRDRDAEGYGWLQNLLKAAGVTAPALAAAVERFSRLEEPETPSTASLLAWVRAINAAAHLSIFCPQKSAVDQIVPLLEEGIALCRAIGEPASRELAWALIQKRTHLKSVWMDNERSDRGYQEILEICRRNGYRFEEAFCLYQMEKSFFDHQKCIDEFAAALAIFESLGETDMTATAQVFLAFWLYPTGDYNRSRLLLQQGLAYLKKVGNITGWCRWIIWQFFLFPEPANARLADEALAYLQNLEHVPFTIGSFVVLAETEWALGNYERAEGIARQAQAANQAAKSPYISAFTHLVLGRCAFSS
jgi:tetratricopeptide (TPR) repeat protein